MLSSFIEADPYVMPSNPLEEEDDDTESSNLLDSSLGAPVISTLDDYQTSSPLLSKKRKRVSEPQPGITVRTVTKCPRLCTTTKKPPDVESPLLNQAPHVIASTTQRNIVNLLRQWVQDYPGLLSLAPRNEPGMVTIRRSVHISTTQQSEQVLCSDGVTRMFADQLLSTFMFYARVRVAFWETTVSYMTETSQRGGGIVFSLTIPMSSGVSKTSHLQWRPVFESALQKHTSSSNDMNTIVFIWREMHICFDSLGLI